jgi:myxalamid-type polyketide synthase MxaB
MTDIKKKIENLTPEQKLKLLRKIKEKKNGSFSSAISSKEVIVTKFDIGDNFAYKLRTPVNFLKSEFVKTEIDDPLPNMVQVETKAASLNFRDLMIAMGLYPDTPGIPAVMGSDYSGVITKTGNQVKKLKVGDKVMVLSAGSFNKHEQLEPNSHFSKYMNIYEKQVFPMPVSSSFIQAACIPTTYITCYYALITLGQLKKDDTVLIHTATGGVGLAAIEICNWIGCKIFATAGNDKKRSLLKKMGIPLVMDSRTTNFEEEIKNYTKGRGVDVVLNTLSGDGMIAGINSLAYFGRFLQIDKKDIAMKGSLPLVNFNKGLSFYAIDIGLLVKNNVLTGDIIYQLGKLIDHGSLKPIKSRVYTYSQLGDALNYMSRSEHIGKLVLDYS